MKQPPRIARWVLSITNRKCNREIILGDYEEFYDEIYSERGTWFANIWYYKQAVQSIPKFMNSSILWGSTMLKNYFKIAFRSMINQKFYSIINITGLSIGISACILVALYIKHDFSYDQYHKNAEQIYRIYFSHTEASGTLYEAETPALLGPTLKNQYPEIKKFTRIYFSKHNLVKVKDKKYYEDRISYADSTFFEIFTYDAIVGNKTKFLKKANSIVLTESTANKYFGNENPLGKELEINNEFRFEVAGVIKDVPINSHFKFDFLATYSSLERQREAIYLPQWGATFGSYTYMLVNEEFNPGAFEKKTASFFNTYTNMPASGMWTVLVQPLLGIHLNSHLANEIEENSSVSRIFIIGSIAMFILLLACINFVNLSTARSSKRAVEIGVRKVLGAFKIQLIKQFLTESVLLSIISLVISFITVIIVIPYFSTLVGTEIGFDLSNNWIAILIIMGGVLLVGILAGAYPAIFISSYLPIKAINGSTYSQGGKKSTIFLRKGLVVLQFAISIILIAGTIIVNLQLNYMREYNMGFDKEYMLVLPTHKDVSKSYMTLKNELKNIPGIVSVSACEGAPISGNGMITECKPNGYGTPEAFRIYVNSVDFDYMDHFGIEIVAGRNFSSEFQSDFTKAMIINEKMCKSLGFTNGQDAIGKSYFISLNGYKPEIIGVVKDFNSNSLHNEILPQVFMHKPNWFSEFVVKVNSSSIASTIGRLENIWAKFFPDYPFEYHFLDESIDMMYKSEARYSKVISTFSAIALFIACLGLLGLTSYVTEQRKKEIGIRKVLGASVKSIIQIILREFVTLVIIANIIAWPVAYFFMNKWLQDFAYRTDISWWIFILSGCVALLIALLTVSYQAIKAAITNPINSIKYE